MTWYYLDYPVDDIEPGDKWYGFTYMIQNHTTNSTWIGYQQFKDTNGFPVDWRNSWGDDSELLAAVYSEPGLFTKTIVELAETPEQLLEKFKNIANAAIKIYSAK